ncbi:hypothetical protein CVT26_012903 [Gymnopilus dilepis]|uniref:Uncharacterized protein n=1 Tax=Gymnopilus dilepis TaxID=231916 RepID=A0A409Y4E1_9AGAR|nr:hypothetical protein CVT26_012903 [Gymnopilus dilepis]
MARAAREQSPSAHLLAPSHPAALVDPLDIHNNLHNLRSWRATQMASGLEFHDRNAGENALSSTSRSLISYDLIENPVLTKLNFMLDWERTLDVGHGVSAEGSRRRGAEGEFLFVGSPRNMQLGNASADCSQSS